MTKAAVILAAGRGSRLDPGGKASEFSKPLMEVGGKTMLQRTVESCRLAGAERIVVVTGFRTSLVEAEVARLDRGDLVAVYNDRWDMSNGLSLLACRHLVRGDFALMMSDHIFDPSILADLLALSLTPESVVLAVDRKIADVFDIDDATKVRVEDERIVAISKQLDDYNAIDCGLFACTPVIFDALEYVMDMRGDCSLSDGMRIVGDQGRFLPFDIGARWWQDVDTPEMLAQAQHLLGMAVATPAQRSSQTAL